MAKLSRVKTRRHKGYPAIRPQVPRSGSGTQSAGESVYRYGVMIDGAFEWGTDRPKPNRQDPEVTGLIDLSAIAKALVTASPKPMVIILVPQGEGE